MNESLDKDLLLVLNNALARAEAILAESEKRILHEPTVEFYRGQKVLAEQLLLYINGDISEDEIIHGEIVRGTLKLYNEDGSPYEPDC